MRRHRQTETDLPRATLSSCLIELYRTHSATHSCSASWLFPRTTNNLTSSSQRISTLALTLLLKAHSCYLLSLAPVSLLLGPCLLRAVQCLPKEKHYFHEDRTSAIDNFFSIIESRQVRAPVDSATTDSVRTQLPVELLRLSAYILTLNTPILLRQHGPKLNWDYGMRISEHMRNADRSNSKVDWGMAANSRWIWLPFLIQWPDPADPKCVCIDLPWCKFEEGASDCRCPASNTSRDSPYHGRQQRYWTWSRLLFAEYMGKSASYIQIAIWSYQGRMRSYNNDVSYHNHTLTTKDPES